MSEHERIQEALRECQKKFLSLFRESPLVLEMTSAKDDRYIDVNDTFQRITGWTRDEVIGRTPYDINIMVDPSQRVNVVKQLLRDWGIGFVPEEVLKGPAFGLTTMKEWLKLVHGELSIESQPQRGTTIQARVPLIAQAGEGRARAVTALSFFYAPV
jgi:PAS domain-containing protein